MSDPYASSSSFSSSSFSFSSFSSNASALYDGAPPDPSGWTPQPDPSEYDYGYARPPPPHVYHPSGGAYALTHATYHQPQTYNADHYRETSQYPSSSQAYTSSSQAYTSSSQAYTSSSQPYASTSQAYASSSQTYTSSSQPYFAHHSYSDAYSVSSHSPALYSGSSSSSSSSSSPGSQSTPDEYDPTQPQAEYAARFYEAPPVYSSLSASSSRASSIHRMTGSSASSSSPSSASALRISSAAHTAAAVATAAATAVRATGRLSSTEAEFSPSSAIAPPKPRRTPPKARPGYRAPFTSTAPPSPAATTTATSGMPSSAAPARAAPPARSLDRAQLPPSSGRASASLSRFRRERALAAKRTRGTSSTIHAQTSSSLKHTIAKHTSATASSSALSSRSKAQTPLPRLINSAAARRNATARGDNCPPSASRTLSAAASSSTAWQDDPLLCLPREHFPVIRNPPLAPVPTALRQRVFREFCKSLLVLLVPLTSSSSAKERAAARGDAIDAALLLEHHLFVQSDSRQAYRQLCAHQNGKLKAALR